MVMNISNKGEGKSFAAKSLFTSIIGTAVAAGVLGMIGDTMFGNGINLKEVIAGTVDAFIPHIEERNDTIRELKKEKEEILKDKDEAFAELEESESACCQLRRELENERKITKNILKGEKKASKKKVKKK